LSFPTTFNTANASNLNKKVTVKGQQFKRRRTTPLTTTTTTVNSMADVSNWFHVVEEIKRTTGSKMLKPLPQRPKSEEKQISHNKEHETVSIQ
jgi:hypothetical protein